MAISSVLGFWAVAALLILVPGPDWAFAISAGLRGHPVAGAVGIVLGYLVMTVAVAAGLGALIVSSRVALTALTVVGSLYLVLLGATIVARPGAAQEMARAPGTPVGAVVGGFGVSGLNPKGLLIFVALLPQFTSPHDGWPIAGQLGLLGAVFTLTCAAVYLVVGACAQRVLRTRSRAARLVSRVSGVCLIGVGAVLLTEHLLVPR